MISMYLRITSLAQLKKESGNGAEFFILLNHNLRSSKWIRWDEERELFLITNYIDGTEQVLTEKQVMEKLYTNIGYAMTKGALCKDG